MGAHLVIAVGNTDIALLFSLVLFTIVQAGSLCRPCGVSAFSSFC